MLRIIDSTIIIFFICAIACKQKPAPETLPQTGVYLDTSWIAGNDTLRYRMLLPVDFQYTRQYPLVLFLHGMGERGTDNQTQLTHGSKLFLDSIEQYPAIVIFPQCPPTDYWANLDRSDFDSDSLRLFKYRLNENPHPSLGMVIDLLGNLIHQPYVDTTRVYLSGLSMGAMGAYDILWRMPNTFAVCMPICGSGPIEKAGEFQQTPFWIFHGSQDRTVATRHSIEMVDTLKALNANVRFTLYPDANHNSWDSAFAEPEFLKWMFSHQLKKDQ
jgi:predicted peptidase